jgi:hypothetical protein
MEIPDHSDCAVGRFLRPLRTERVLDANIIDVGYIVWGISTRGMKAIQAE